MDNFNIFIHKLFLGKLKKLKKKIVMKIGESKPTKYILLFTGIVLIYTSFLGSIVGGIILGLTFLIILTDFLSISITTISLLKEILFNYLESFIKKLLVECFYYYKKFIYNDFILLRNYFNKIYNSVIIALMLILSALSVSEYYIMKLLNPNELIETIINGNITLSSPIKFWLYLVFGVLITRYIKTLSKIVLDKFISWRAFLIIFLVICFYKYTGLKIPEVLLIFASVSFLIILVLAPLKNNLSLEPKIFKYLDLYYKEAAGMKKEFLSMAKIYFEIKVSKLTIKPISDAPISMKNADIFGYASISENIYKLIKGISSDEIGSYSIGIIGEWGLGKSSIIGILKESRLKLDSKIIIHDFNPWNYSKKDLVNNFITEIASKIGEKDLTRLLFEYIETLSSINSVTGVILKLMKIILGKERTIEEIRNLISEELKKTNKKLVIIVDDLDRCEPEEIITMLNVVKNIGNFSHVIYLISFDKINIIKALKNRGFHEDYIEKIINTEIHLPIPDKETKASYFCQNFTQILGELGVEKDKINETCENITNIGTSGLDEIFEKENLRLIKKLLNNLNVNFKLAYNNNNKRFEGLSKEDFANIVLINYIKIKYLDFYNDAIKKRNIMSPDTFVYKTPNRPTMYLNMKERRLEKLFLDKIIGLTITIEDDTLGIHNKNTLKDVPDLAYQLENLNRNWLLLREFS